jgi:tetratricopeptide (TPR) repeat protein
MTKHSLDKGLDCLGQGKIYEAYEVLDELRRRNARDPLPWLFIGDLYLLNDDIKEGRQAHLQAIKLDERGSYPKAEVKAAGGGHYASWRMTFTGKKLDKESVEYEKGKRLTGTLGIPLFGSKGITLKIPHNYESTENRTTCLQAILAPLHPYIGKHMAITVGTSRSEYKMDAEKLQKKLGEKKKTRFGKERLSEQWTEHGAILYILDEHKSALGSYSWALTLNPWNTPAQIGLMKCLRRLSTKERISDFEKDSWVREKLDDAGFLDEILRYLRPPPDYLVTRYDAWQIAFRIFQFIDYNGL